MGMRKGFLNGGKGLFGQMGGMIRGRGQMDGMMPSLGEDMSKEEYLLMSLEDPKFYNNFEDDFDDDQLD